MQAKVFLPRIAAFVTVILAERFLSKDIYSPIFIFIGVAILSVYGFQKKFIEFTWPLLIIAALGIFGTEGKEARDILRDISLSITPISLLYLGYWIAADADIWPMIRKIIGGGAVIFAVIHLSSFAVNPELIYSSYLDVRKVAGGTNNLVTLMLVIYFSDYRGLISSSPPKVLQWLVVYPLLFASFVLAFSRTDLIVAVLLFAPLLVNKFNNRRFSKSIIFSVLAIFLVTFLMIYNDDGDGFLMHILRSLSEVAIANYQDPQEINDNWRGYEAYRAIIAYGTGTNLQLMIGQGFGAVADLGFYINLSEDVSYRYIPIFHNGYVYVLLKTGLIGLICYIIFFIKIIILSTKNKGPEYKVWLFNRLMLGCLLVLMVTMYVVNGMAQGVQSAYVLLLGFFLRIVLDFEKKSYREIFIGRDLRI